jgi:hypothetical protein
MFDDVIEILLQKKENLRAEIEREFAERSAKIDSLLTACGYVEPKVVEEELPIADEKEENKVEEEVESSPFVVRPISV